MADPQHRGPRPAPEPDDHDAPPTPAHETTSAMFRRAAAEGVRAGLDASSRSLADPYPVGAKLLRWLAGVLVFAASGAGAGYVASHPAPEPVAPVSTERRPECNPLLEQVALHNASAGETLARALEADDLHKYAALVRELHDIDSQPADIRLCILLRSRTETAP